MRKLGVRWWRSDVVHDSSVWRETGYLKEPQGLGQSADLLLQGEDAGDHLRLLAGLLLQVHGAPSPLLRETQHFNTWRFSSF